ncbi:MAG: hypothetical protein MRK02_13235 [Candidatus Scalindua sp.]|nr:hypothetical protein [Candidatus Scalindua sp.]
MMNYKAWFQCASGCDEQYELNEIIYKCRKCGGLLEVRHDIEKLKKGTLNPGRNSLINATEGPHGHMVVLSGAKKRWYVQM